VLKAHAEFEATFSNQQLFEKVLSFRKAETQQMPVMYSGRPDSRFMSGFEQSHAAVAARDDAVNNPANTLGDTPADVDGDGDGEGDGGGACDGNSASVGSVVPASGLAAAPKPHHPKCKLRMMQMLATNLVQ
jgi:hypothetical protein